MSGMNAPKLMPSVSAEVMRAMWRKAPSKEVREALCQLLGQAYLDHPLAASKTGYGSEADRASILSQARVGHFSVVRQRLDLGQAGLPRDVVDQLLASITLLWE